MSSAGGFCRRVLFPVLSLVFLSLGHAFSGAIEDAQALFNEKKYSEVDKALQPILGGPSPTAEALSLSLSAAEASGRYVTAQYRATALLKVVGDADLPTLFRCARVSALAGDEALATTRFLAYARQQKEKTPELKLALLGLLSAGDYPMEFKQLVEYFGADEAAWRIGFSLFERLCVARRGKEATDIAELLLAKYPNTLAVDAVFQQLRNAGERSELGANSEERFIRPLFAMIKYKPSSVEHPVFLLQQGWHQLTEPQRSQISFDIQGMAPTTPLFTRYPSLMGGFKEMKSLSGEALAKAARDFLALEPVYKGSGNPEEYRSYLEVLADLPMVFGAGETPLVKVADLEGRLDELVVRYGGNANSLDTIIRNISGRYLKTDEERKVFLTKWSLKSSPDRGCVSDLLGKISGNERSAFLTAYAQGRAFKDGLDLRVASIPHFVGIKDKATVAATLNEYFAAYTGTYNLDLIEEQFLRSTLFSDEEKVAMLTALATKSGYNKLLVQLMNRVTKVTQGNKEAAAKYAAIGKMLEAKEKLGGTDLSMKTITSLAAININSANPDVKIDAIAQSFLGAYQGTVPGGFEQTKSLADLQAVLIFYSHLAHVEKNRDGIQRCASIWAPRLGDGSAWHRLSSIARGNGSTGALAVVAPLYLKLIGEGAGSAAILMDLSYAQGVRGEANSLFASVYPKMGGWAAVNYIAQNRDHWPRDFFFQQILTLASLPGSFPDWGQLRWLTGEITARIDGNNKAPVELTSAIWQNYLTTRVEMGAFDPWFEGQIFAQYTRAGRTAEAGEWMKAYQPLLGKRSPVQKASAIAGLLDGMADETAGGDLVPGLRMHTMIQLFAPVYSALDEKDRRLVPVTNGLAYAVKRYVREWASKPDAAVAIALQFQLAKSIADGASVSAQTEHYLPLFSSAIGAAAEAKDYEVAVVLVRGLSRLIGRDADWNRNMQSVIRPAIQALRTAGADEISYLLSDQILSRNTLAGGIAKELALQRTTDAKNLPMTLSVAADDPTYDLHLASNELTRNNETLAWELTKPKIKLISSSWEKLSPDYLAWTIDQLRKTTEEENLKTALELCNFMLLEEGKLEPSVTATISLLKGDIYRDQQNFQASRIEYESLMNNKGLAKTKPGSQAKFRLIANYILTQDYEKADALMTRYEEDVKTDVRAEIAYLRGTMAYQREEYSEAGTALKTVLDIDPNHVEATLLLANVNHKLMRLDNTDVAIGELEDKFTVVPGKELVLSLNDPGKNVAQTAAAIPITLKTSKGGDIEQIILRPKQNNRSLFTGIIPTGIGEVIRGNHKLELRGDDEVLYQIEPEFQKRMNLNYPQKKLDVRSNGTLQASSGRILTEEEQDALLREKALEERMGKDSGASVAGSRRLEARNTTTVRPGSPIYVQVIDLDQDLGPEKDKALVDVTTESGDVLRGFALTETGSHTGVFRGEIPTGLPFPRGNASDSQEGKGANGLISLGSPGPWMSVEDGKKPKWVEVDTMTSVKVSGASLTMKNPGVVKLVHLEGMLVGNYERIVSFPESLMAGASGLQLSVADDYDPKQPNTPEGMRRHLLTAKTRVHQKHSYYNRELTEMRGNRRLTCQLRGAFYLPEETTLELKFLQDPSPSSSYPQYAYLFIDQRKILGGLTTVKSLENIVQLKLPKGGHDYELLLTDFAKESQFIIGYRQSDGTFAPLPPEWFSALKYPELADFLKPKAKIQLSDNVFQATFSEPVRLRKLRWLFEDYEGNLLSAEAMTVLDETGKKVIPTAEDFSMGLKNKQIEISSGDRITVSYNDIKNLRKDTPILNFQLESSFFDGSIAFVTEVIEDISQGKRRIDYLPTSRATAGDQVTVLLDDWDLDLTDSRDTVKIEVTTSSGEKTILDALETGQVDVSVKGSDPHAHAGRFLGILKIGDITGPNAIKVLPGDVITARYLDSENTDPGIPIERMATIEVAGQGSPEIVVYKTSIEMVEDTGLLAKARLANMHLSKEEKSTAVILKPQVIARHPDYTDKGETSNTSKEITKASVDAPLLFQVRFPEAALHSGSMLKVEVMAESEVAAAKKEERQPKALLLEVGIHDLGSLANQKGYGVRVLTNQRFDTDSLLLNGIFTGVVRLQMGSPGDAVNDLVIATASNEFVSGAEREGVVNKVPTLIVSGSDTLTITVKSGTEAEEKVVGTSTVQLLSNARMELLDRSYAVANTQIYLGDRFFVRVTDPDQDITSDLDEVNVTVTAKSGDRLSIPLRETAVHSGVFLGSILPEFVQTVALNKAPKTVDGNPVPGSTDAASGRDPTDAFLGVEFGDELTFDYEDVTSVDSDTPVKRSLVGRIHLGTDGVVTLFSKRFKDPEMAVKVRFLTAEAKFELAKDLRNLKKTEKADEAIKEGKRILEEAIRDYPGTNQAAQGEFLLANLAMELTLFDEAITRFTNVIGTWPDSEYAPRSQFHLAKCLESKGEFDSACEEFVKLTYLYPDSDLVKDATIRLGDYYYKSKRFDIAAKIFSQFQQRFPDHPLAAKSLFLAAQCAMQEKAYTVAIPNLIKLIETYDEKDLVAEASYWLGESYNKSKDMLKSYQTFKKLTWDFPDTKWAKIARGRLTEEEYAKMDE